MGYWISELIKYFDIKNPTVWTVIQCPYHEDTKPSAGININKGYFNCFVCGSKKLKELHTDIFGKQKNGMSKKFELNIDIETLLKTTEKPKLAQAEILEHLKKLIEEKSLTRETLQKIKAVPITDSSHHLFGYLGIPLAQNKYTARKFIPSVQGPKWYNSNGEKPLLITDISSPDQILVEGIWDLTALLQLDYNNIVCNLGTEFNQKRAFQLKGKIVYILFDNDYAGFQGTEKAYDALRRIKAYPIVLELPNEFGNDVNDAYKNPAFSKWLKKHLTQVETSDVGYFDNTDEDLIVHSTGFSSLDQFFQGGYRPGVHVIAGEPGAGKSAILLWMAVQWITKNPNVKVLYNTYEISKRQCWARITAQFDEYHNWVEIETGKEPTSAAKNKSKDIAQRLKIIAGTDISEIVRASRFYDIIIVDYIQRMPGDTDSEKFNIGKNIRILSDLARDKDKIIVCASSIPRSGYGKDELSIFKESGDIEFVIQSGLKIKDTNHDGEHRILQLTVLKNTRGALYGNVWIEGNMLHNKFREIVPME